MCKHRVFCGVAVLVLVAAAQGPCTADNQAVQDFMWQWAHGYTNVTQGWAFRVTRPIEVTWLGYYDVMPYDNDEVGYEQIVSIWTIDGNLLTQEDVPYDGAGLRWHWKQLSSEKRVVLLPNQLYVISHYSSGSMDGAWRQNVPFDPAVEWLGARRLTSGYGFPLPVSPNGYTGIFGPNFRFTDPVPEPAGMQLAVLLALGCAGLLRRRCARQ